MRTRGRRSERGQVIVLLAAALTALILATGLVVDVGMAFSRQRESQNAADFAAMAGARVLGELLLDDHRGRARQRQCGSSAH